MKKISAVLLILLTISSITYAKSNSTLRASGIVFNDLNKNGAYESNEPILEGIRVSNGVDVVETDSSGKYSLAVEDGTIIFVIKPKGYMTWLDENNLPKFYYIYQPQGSINTRYPGVKPTGPLANSVDFPLYERTEPEKFEVIMFGDPQVGSIEHVDYLAHDLVEELIGYKAAFGLTLGDIVDNNLDLFEPLNEVISQIGVSWYNVFGNHDRNIDVEGDFHSKGTFKRIYGPTYYSFDYGQVHFLVIDNILSFQSRNGRLKYRCGIDDRQMQFIENDLSYISKNQLVVAVMHIPPIVYERINKSQTKLFSLLRQFPNSLSIAGHEHIFENHFLGQEYNFAPENPHHFILLGAACGSWWSGIHDEMGLPHAMMTCGTPNGYSIFTFDKNTYSMRYKVARKPADYQMNIWAPNKVNSEDPNKTDVIVNFFAGSPKAQVQMKVGDLTPWITLENTQMHDPYFVQLQNKNKELGVKKIELIGSADESKHIWKGSLPGNLKKGTHTIYVTIKDYYGQVHAGKRIIRIE